MNIGGFFALVFIVGLTTLNFLRLMIKSNRERLDVLEDKVFRLEYRIWKLENPSKLGE